MKNVKFYIAALAALVSVGAASNVSAQGPQGKGDASGIAIMAITPTGFDGLPSGAEAALKNKMDQIATATGLGSMNRFSQFCMLVNIDVEQKEVLGGSPPKIAQTLNFNFSIVDQFNKNVFSHATVRAKAVGNSETKAYVDAIRQLNARSGELASFVSDGRRKIIDYYNANCDKIIAKARSLAAQDQYEEAFFLLTSIPDVCTDCYMKAMEAAEIIFQDYIDHMCNVNLAKAKAIWSATQSSEGGLAAGVFLSEIYPDAKCYPEAEKLYNEITAKIEKYIDFEMKKWDDAVSLESQRIGAMRDIGMAWGSNQQPITYAPAWIH